MHLIADQDLTLVQQPPYLQLTLREHPLPPSPLLEISIKPHITFPQTGNVSPAATPPSGQRFAALPLPEYWSSLNSGFKQNQSAHYILTGPLAHLISAPAQTHCSSTAIQSFGTGASRGLPCWKSNNLLEGNTLCFFTVNYVVILETTLSTYRLFYCHQ